MSSYIFRRLLQGIPTFFGITILSFLLMLTAPGDPVSMIMFNPSATPEAVATMRRQLGLDQPPLTQYIYWLVGNDWAQIDSDGDGVGDSYGLRHGLLRGDLGQSLKHKRPVSELIAERIPATLQLTVSALIVGYGLGALLGVLSAVYHRSWFDQSVRLLSVVGTAVPAFWLGLIFIIIFSVTLDWLPMSGMSDITNRSGGFDLIASLKHLIMPVSVLALGIVASVARFTRTEMLETLHQDFIRTAHAKGLNNRRVWWRHAIRNALIPIATFLGPELGGLLGGAVIIEQVFGWPGMGRLVVNGVFQRDYPLVMGSVVVGAVLFIIGLLLSDMLYAWLDPRIRLS